MKQSQRELESTILRHRAAARDRLDRIAKDLITGNVVKVLTICEDFGLNQLGDRILEQSRGGAKGGSKRGRIAAAFGSPFEGQAWFVPTIAWCSRLSGRTGGTNSGSL